MVKGSLFQGGAENMATIELEFPEIDPLYSAIVHPCHNPTEVNLALSRNPHVKRATVDEVKHNNERDETLDPVRYILLTQS
jgi:hypothetical protein